jgi:hypothetical protein
MYKHFKKNNNVIVLIIKKLQNININIGIQKLKTRAQPYI